VELKYGEKGVCCYKICFLLQYDGVSLAFPQALIASREWGLEGRRALHTGVIDNVPRAYRGLAAAAAAAATRASHFLHWLAQSASASCAPYKFHLTRAPCYAKSALYHGRLWSTL
jgi:hypothetical protein